MPTPDQVIEAIRSGDLKPVYLLVGEERYLRNRVVEAAHAATLALGVPGLNEDDFSATQTDPLHALTAARTLPMMARRRWVLVRDVERWDSKGKAQTARASKGKKSSSPLDQVAQYAEAPSESTTLVLIAEKLDARRKLMVLAKQKGFLVPCELLAKNALPGWLHAAAERRKTRLSSGAAELIAEVAGPELSVLDDIIERLSLFAGSGNPITEDTVGEVIPIVRPATVWELVDAVGRGDIAETLARLARVYDPQDRGLRLLSVLLWSTRQLLRYQAARTSGKSPPDAAKAAGAAPFRARILEGQARRWAPEELESWLSALRDVDLQLKGGSKRPPQAILEAALIRLCARSASPSGSSRL